MNKTIKNLLMLLTSVLLLAGCGDQIDKSAFNHADPELKAVWERAIAADRAGDYVGANTNYVALLRQPVSPEQLLAVQGAVGALNQRMNQAADKGDAAAKKALETLRAMQERQGRPRPGRPQ